MKRTNASGPGSLNGKVFARGRKPALTRDINLNVPFLRFVMLSSFVSGFILGIVYLYFFRGGTNG